MKATTRHPLTGRKTRIEFQLIPEVRVVRGHGLPARTLLNVNVPRGMPKGVKVTVQGMRNHVTKVAASMDPRGRPYYWIEEGEDTYADGDRADHVAVREGYVSVTPLQPDLTAHHALAAVEALAIEKAAEVR